MGGAKLLAFMAIVTVAASSKPAGAQCRLCDKPTTTRDDATAADDVRLEVETTLNFDRLILFGNGDGAAVLRPDGSSAAQGSVAEVSPRAMVGTVVVHGQPGRAIRVELPKRIQLYSLGGGQITFDDLTSDLPSLPRLDSVGDLTFRFGGRLRVTGNAEGDYRGDLPITVEYQ
jgi:hypothetical protein